MRGLVLRAVNRFGLSSGWSGGIAVCMYIDGRGARERLWLVPACDGFLLRGYRAVKISSHFIVVKIGRISDLGPRSWLKLLQFEDIGHREWPSRKGFERTYLVGGEGGVN